MSKILGAIIFVALAVSLVSLMYRPIAAAKARQIDMQSQITYERESARIAAESARAARNEAISDAVTPDLITMWRIAIYTAGAAAIVITIFLAASVVYTTAGTIRAVGASVGDRSRLWSHTLRLDKRGTYGIVFSDDWNWMTNLDTELTIRLDKPHETSELAQTGLTGVQMAGIAARENHKQLIRGD